MATYTVSYRGKNGERIEEQFEAPDRNSLFNILADRKISAINVREGSHAKRAARAMTKGASSPYRKWIVAGVVSIVVALVSLIVLSRADEDQPHNEVPRKSKRILDVRPSLPAAKTQEVPRKKTYDELRKERNEIILKEARDKARAQGLPWADTPRKTVNIPQPPKRFKYDSEGHIAALLEVKPGTPIIGSFEFGEDFIEDLKKSLEEPVEILPDDDEYLQELKHQVQETKDEFRKMLSRGEDVGSIMRDTRKQLQTMGIAQMQIQEQMHELLDKPEVTSDDLKTFEEAANIILANKGLDPLKMPKYWTRRVKILEAQEKGEINEH